MRFPFALLIVSLLVPAAAMAQGNETAPTNATETPASPTPPAEPAPPEDLVIEIEGHQDGESYYFTLAGESAKNPTITVRPGQKVTFQFTAVTGSHNVRLTTGDKTAVIEDASATLEWTAPAEAASLEYWCEPHKSNGMRGRLVVAEPKAPGSGDTGGAPAGEISGDTVDLGAAFPNNPACQGKQASALVNEDVVGVPRLADYDNPACTTGYTPPKPDHVADYVIPLSWGLIGLGIVGVVWVHKYYKP